MTIKAQRPDDSEIEPQERTLRPLYKKRSKTEEQMSRGHQRAKSSFSRAAGAINGNSSKPKSPTKSHFGTKFELPPRLDLAYREQPVEDFSDLLFDENVFTNKPLNNLVLRKVGYDRHVSGSSDHANQYQPDSPQLFQPSDLTSLPKSIQSPVGGSMRRQTSSRPSVLADRPMRRTRSSIEIQKFAEDEGDEDFSDIFEADKEESDRGSEDGGGLMLMSKISSSSWLGDEEEEDDPFAAMDPGWDEMNLEANIARDRHARLTEKVEELVRFLKRTEGEDKLAELSETLVCSIFPCPDMH